MVKQFDLNPYNTISTGNCSFDNISQTLTIMGENITAMFVFVENSTTKNYNLHAVNFTVVVNNYTFPNSSCKYSHLYHFQVATFCIFFLMKTYMVAYWIYIYWYILYEFSLFNDLHKDYMFNNSHFTQYGITTLSDKSVVVTICVKWLKRWWEREFQYVTKKSIFKQTCGVLPVVCLHFGYIGWLWCYLYDRVPDDIHVLVIFPF